MAPTHSGLASLELPSAMYAGTYVGGGWLRQMRDRSCMHTRLEMREDGQQVQINPVTALMTSFT